MPDPTDPTTATVHLLVTLAIDRGAWDRCYGDEDNAEDARDKPDRIAEELAVMVRRGVEVATTHLSPEITVEDIPDVGAVGAEAMPDWAPDVEIVTPRSPSGGR